MSPENNIINEMAFQLSDNLLKKWYPLVLDKNDGGFLTNLCNDFRPSEQQDKMIVTQARHIWTLAKAAKFYSDDQYEEMAYHGAQFLKDKMWDKSNCGFFQIRSKSGNFSETEGWLNEKRVYGNAYGLFALSALYDISNNSDILKFANEVFNWIEVFAHDKKAKGYFQFFKEDNTIIDSENDYKSIASDSVEIGFKDQNSSIHLLEAFTEFYHIHNFPLLKERLTELLILIRDTLVNKKGFLHLFFHNDWEPVSFANSIKEIREANYRLDHVSFGHDYETAFLMLEASHVLNIENDVETLRIAKNMVDHALENGWDNQMGGFYDEGYYFKNNEKCSIIKDTKNWWAQAEALNIFLIMAKLFPNENKYFDTFIKEWEYINNYLIDHENGDWFLGGLDKEPHHKFSPKGEIWKGTYHTSRALMNCISILADENYELYKSSAGFREKVLNVNEFINHWKKTSELL